MEALTKVVINRLRLQEAKQISTVSILGPNWTLDPGDRVAEVGSYIETLKLLVPTLELLPGFKEYETEHW